MSTNIPFVNETWNPWQGCTKVSAGCTNCYMYREKSRYGQNPAVVGRSSDKTFYKPETLQSGTWVFICSWSDFFIEQADAWRHEAWNIIRNRPDIAFVIITKRVELINLRLPKDWGNGYKNVIMGFTAEDQGWFDRRWKLMRNIPAVNYLCIHEPALGGIHFADDFLALQSRSWIIAGGESGGVARPAHGSWFESDRDQAQLNNVPFFFKSWGEWEWITPGSQIIADYSDIYKWPDKSISLHRGVKKSGSLLNKKIYNMQPVVELQSSPLSLFNQECSNA